MFATFKMDLPELQKDEDWKKFYLQGQKVYENQRRGVRKALDKYLSPDGELKASEIEQDWFPTVKADVFLSHSHKDEYDVIALAGFLHEQGLNAFIDSCVWGYADDLLKQIDDEYCVSGRKADGSIDTYGYGKRNQSTAHVHMILNGALMKMMDKTECLIFLDTPNSIKAKDILQATTNSCWIYSELLMSKYLRRIEPIRKSFSHSVYESVTNSALSVEYDVDISHLIQITLEEVTDIAETGMHKGLEILDQLYLLKKIRGGK